MNVHVGTDDLIKPFDVKAELQQLSNIASSLPKHKIPFNLLGIAKALEDRKENFQPEEYSAQRMTLMAACVRAADHTLEGGNTLNWEANWGFGLLTDHLSRYRRSFKFLDAAAGQQPDDVKIRFKRLTILKQLAEINEFPIGEKRIIGEATDLVHDDPDNGHAYSLLAGLHEVRGHPQTAIETLRWGINQIGADQRREHAFLLNRISAIHLFHLHDPEAALRDSVSACEMHQIRGYPKHLSTVLLAMAPRATSKNKILLRHMQNSDFSDARIKRFARVTAPKAISTGLLCTNLAKIYACFGYRDHAALLRNAANFNSGHDILTARTELKALGNHFPQP